MVAPRRQIHQQGPAARSASFERIPGLPVPPSVKRKIRPLRDGPDHVRRVAGGGGGDVPG